MIPQANITAWRAVAPWSTDAQVEQDLVLSRAVVELFSIPDMKGKIALRGGTALNKLFLKEPVRYSEDIDLVQIVPAPVGPLLDAIRAKLDPWLGPPRRQIGRMVTLAYRFESEIAPVQPLRLKIEINTHEHFTVLGYQEHSFTVKNPWFTGAAAVTTYMLDELMGTKLRALYQRRKGRDLFDLWLTLEHNRVDPNKVVECFNHYMHMENHPVTREQFEQNLAQKANDKTFRVDIAPLLASTVVYDADVAIARIMQSLISRLT